MLGGGAVCWQPHAGTGNLGHYSGYSKVEYLFLVTRFQLGWESSTYFTFTNLLEVVTVSQGFLSINQPDSLPGMGEGLLGEGKFGGPLGTWVRRKAWKR